ncbi:hypothetical protein ACOSP7_013414 [Xanthoceras sorbifolium]
MDHPCNHNFVALLLTSLLASPKAGNGEIRDARGSSRNDALGSDNPSFPFIRSQNVGCQEVVEGRNVVLSKVNPTVKNLHVFHSPELKQGVRVQPFEYNNILGRIDLGGALLVFKGYGVEVSAGIGKVPHSDSLVDVPLEVGSDIANKQIHSDDAYGSRKRRWKRRAWIGMIIIEEFLDTIQ